MNSDRRTFMKTTGAIAATAALTSTMSVHASNDETIKIGLVGCGGRGGGAIRDSLNADPNVRLMAMADVFEDNLKAKLNNIKKAFTDRVDVPEDRQFVGFDAYKELLKLDLDYVIFATPPYFRPQHALAAAEAGMNIFTEKPVAVDPAGCFTVMKAGEILKEKGKSWVAGTQRRHQHSYREVYKRVQDGAIGDVVACRAYWNGGQLWYKERRPEWNDMEWMIRDWVNWTWLSGDHIVEQHVHNIDVCNWFKGSVPVSAVGMGGRARRVTGNQYDYFAVDFEYPDGSHMASYCRQVNGCANNVSETIVGSKGTCGGGWIKGESSFNYGKDDGRKDLPYVQEHIDLIKSIRNNEGLNEAYNVASSTLTAIMGRIAAYTGKKVTYKQLEEMTMKLGPEIVSYDTSLMDNTVPVQGKG